MKAEVTPTDAASSCPLLFLLFSGLLWLVLSGILGLAAGLQVPFPQFLAECPVLTHGRLSAVAETAFVYGWLANAGLALVLWILSRLAAEPLRAQNWALVGTSFWNLGVTAAVIGVATGDATGFPLLGLPGYVQLILFFSYGAIAAGGLLAWSGRLRQVSYAAQWYAAAALFLFPWILSIAHVMLFSAPVRGVEQAVVASWYAQCVLLLWLVPFSLAVAYYVIPKVTGRVLPSYEFATLGFWSLMVAGGLTAGGHLFAGPVPAWIGSVAVVSFALVLFHVFVIVLNLRGCFFGGGASLKFISFGLAMYAVGAVIDTLTSFHAVSVRTQFTHFDLARGQLALLGAISASLFGGIYYAVPRITGKAWFSATLLRAHLFLSIAGVLLVFGALTVAAVVQSQGLADAKVAFAEINRYTRPWLVAAALGQGVFLFGSIALILNFVATTCGRMKLAQTAQFKEPAAMEAATQ